MLLACAFDRPGELSPAAWDAATRNELQAAEFFGPPAYETHVDGQTMLVSSLGSPVAVHAGMEALRRGGTAADAAATTALTQVATNFGDYVSYAGVLKLVYFERKTGKVFALDAGWMGYRAEQDPESIPGLQDQNSMTVGRQTLTPGFMAGIQAMHDRFGKLPFSDLFQPAIWYAEHGVMVSAAQAERFRDVQAQLWRTPEGRRFASLPGGALPKMGDVFLQPQLADTLRKVSAQGAQYMYGGGWGRAYVAAVRSRGAAASMEDMRSYQAQWREPLRLPFYGATLYTSGEDMLGSCPILEALNLVAGAHIEQRGPYWRDPVSFKTYVQAIRFAQWAHFNPKTGEMERRAGLNPSCGARLSPAYGRVMSPVIGKSQKIDAVPEDTPEAHTNAVVAVDRWGNVAVLVHSINAPTYTGIVVGGIPIGAAGAINKAELIEARPGEHLAEAITPLIALRSGRPILALGVAGTSLVPETVRLIAGVLASRLPLQSILNAPSLLWNKEASEGHELAGLPEHVPAGAYDTAFLRTLQSLGMTVREEPPAAVDALRSQAVVVTIDQQDGRPSALELPGLLSTAESDLPKNIQGPSEVRLEPTALDRYVGDYQAPGAVVRVRRKDDRLFAMMLGYPEIELIPEGADLFFERVLPTKRLFKFDGPGAAKLMIIRRGARDTPCPRVRSKVDAGV